MRRLILLGLVAILALPAAAARRVTVTQLEEALVADNAADRADAEVARRVGEFELSERLTNVTLDRFAGRLTLGPRTALALQLLADQSAFLDPPVNELPATALPDTVMQQRILDAARKYAVQTWSRLPNFFVTRMTTRFDDGPHAQVKGGWPVDLGMQPSGSLSRQITFRDGKEVEDPTAANGTSAKNAQEFGLRSWGEFGPALTIVLADMANHKVTFSHWEQSPTGLAAVFRYAVPREASHYAVTFGYRIEQVIGRTQFGYGGQSRTAQQVANIPKEMANETYSETPGYHGTISIDPATGAVLRITIEAELSSKDPLLRAETMVQYGPVTIGDRQFICPTRSLAISMERGSGSAAGSAMALNGVGDGSQWGRPLVRTGKLTTLMINETSFANYHRLGSTARILMGGSGMSLANPEASSSETQRTASSPVPEATGSNPPPAPPAPGGQQPDIHLAANITPPPAPAIETPETPPPPPAEPVIPEITLDAARDVPDQPAGTSQPTESRYSLKVTSRLVDVGVVAYDKKGHPVNDLKAGDFEVYDNGHKQEIRFFTQDARPNASEAAAVAANAEAEPEHEFSNRAVDHGPLSTPATAGITTILLIDESHIAWSDLNNARQQMIQFLGTLAPSEKVGLYIMTGLGFRVLNEGTTDHAALIARLKKFMPTAQSMSEAQDEERRNRQQINEVHNVTDLNSVNGNHIDVPDSSSPIDPQLMTMGSNPARASLIILRGVARHLSAVLGHKSLVWVSSDNVLADFQDQAVGVDKGDKNIDSYALRAQEAMNDAHVAVYPFDVSQLEAGLIGADMRHRNVELTQAAADVAALGPQGPGGAGGDPSGGKHDLRPGRISAEMSQNLHPIQGTIREVAAATGGRIVRRSGDLAQELSGIVADGHATYMLSFSPQGPADGQYHPIAVKLTGKRGLTLRYRTGYLFDKEPATLKERFQQAIWRPVDVSEIAVTARVGHENAGPNVKIDIAVGDLGLQQQAGRWMDKLDIFFIQRDDAGVHAQVEGQTLGLRLKSTTYERLMPGGIPFEHGIAMQANMASLRVLVVDENSGRIGSVTIPGAALGSGN